ncbi:uncharacterized protein mah [Fopius arisanus]|uniref:Uncharacterized protein mah n=1 Tax=Fopius arisanus TaxID=64838 RepID=A0A9R1T5D7_9HYME|nr:PREDICTED: uncharacterized protein LOC105266837 [Fopius arisanus]
MIPERIPLIHQDTRSGLSIFFAALCIVDIFGVFPIIALPRAIVQCGLLGIPLVIVVVLFQIYTAALLGECWIIAASLDPQILRKNRNPLAAVTEMTLGPRAKTWINILLDLTIFGCGIPNLLVASQNLQLFGLKVSDNQFDLSFCYWLLVVGVLLCPLMWLGSPRDMNYHNNFIIIALFIFEIFNYSIILSAFGWKRCAMRSAVVFLGVAVGESVPRFDIVMSLIGGSLTGPLVFVLPPIMYARARALKSRSQDNPPIRDIISPAQRHQGGTPLVDPKIHSQSTHYGFRDQDHQQRYSYVYFDNDDDLLSDVENTTGVTPPGEAVRMSERVNPVIVDPTVPEGHRNLDGGIEIQGKELRNLYLDRVIYWFGYFVVFIGIGITISSTYINIKNTVRFVNFTPPCIINAAVAGNASNAGGG